MNKRPVCGMAIALCTGIWASSVRAWYAYLTAGGILLLLLFSAASGILPFFFRRANASCKHKCVSSPASGSVSVSLLFLILLYTASLFCGFFFYQKADADSRWYESCDLDDCSVTVSGTVYAKETDEDSETLLLKDAVLMYDNASYQTNCIMIRIYMDDGKENTIFKMEEIHIGNKVSVHGTVSYFSEGRNPGNFDAASFYRTKGIDFRITPGSLEITDSRIRFLPDALNNLKLRFREIFRSCLEEELSAVLETMALGDDSALSDDTQSLYREAGISHILAISGLHVSIIGMMLYRLLRGRGCSYLFSSIPCAFLVLCFGIMSGMGIAVRRAILMFFLHLLADLTGKTYDSLSALAVSAVVLLCANPLLLFSASFQLSFSAVLGVSALWPLIRSFLRPKHESFWISFCIQLVTIPVTLYYYFEIPVFSLPTNAIMIPFVSVLLLDAAAGALAGLVFLPAARIILMPAAGILNGYLFICRLIRRIPGHMLVCGRPSLLRILIYYLLLAMISVFLSLRMPKSETHADAACKISRKPALMRRLSVCAGACILLLIMVLRAPVSFRITMLDVGQGDGILTEAGGYTVFIDGGSSDVENVGTWRILPYLKYRGIGSIDVWMITHTDSDHTSGLEDLYAAGYTIRNLVFAAGVYADDALEELAALAKENGTQVSFLSQGSVLSQGEVTWTLLFPADENSYTDTNDASMVLLLEYRDFTALFTGDITAESEEDMLADRELTDRLRALAGVNGIDLLKVAHHGSAYSSSEAFLEAVNPRAALISAGVNNLYGHPAEETLLRLAAYTDDIYVTAQTGAVVITLRDGEINAETFLQ